MKKIVATSLILMNLSAFAATPVHHSIYMALGAGSDSYFANIKKLKAEVKKALPSKDVMLNTMTFNYAMVEGSEVLYKHFKTFAIDQFTTCTLETEFKVNTDVKEIYDIAAKYECVQDED